MVDKTAIEWAALRTVFKVDDLESVEKREEPDFLLHLYRNSEPFGVEVTQVYRTDSDARMINHPTYISELLAGADHLHRDDVSEFEVVEVTITGPDGTVKKTEVPAIVRQAPSHAEHAASIEEALRGKEARCSNYLQACAHVNLILLDRYDQPYGPDPEYSVGQIITRGLRSALLNTAFREVYLISQSENGIPLVRPLRMLLLMESFYGFIESLRTFEADLPEGDDHSWVFPAFVRAAKKLGLDVSLAGWPRRPEVVFGGSGITTRDNRIIVHDYHDHPLPEPNQLPKRALDANIIAAIASHFETFMESHEFVCGVALPIVEPIHLPGLQRRTRKSKGG